MIMESIMESKLSSDADGAKIQPVKGPKRSVSKKPCEYEDPDHPSFWQCKYKLNPLYKGPADATKPGSQVLVLCVVMCAFIVVKKKETSKKGEKSMQLQ